MLDKESASFGLKMCNVVDDTEGKKDRRTWLDTIELAFEEKGSGGDQSGCENERWLTVVSTGRG